MRSSVLSPWRIAPLLMLPLAMVASPANAQGKLEAQYHATLAGLPIGKGTWVIDIGDTQYTAAASGMTTGLLKVFTGGRATGAAHGIMNGGQTVSSNYATTITTNKKLDEVRVAVSGGVVKEFKVEPPLDDNPERIPVTDALRQGVTDPMTASLVRVPGNGDTRVPEACHRQVSVFDGRLRYDLRLSFKRMDHVESKKGYSGAVVVCSVAFSPVAGFVPSRYAVKYLAKAQDIEIWLAPIAGTRVMVPYRAQLQTPLGLGVVEATQFVTTAAPIRAAKGAKTQ
jgi:hypothetical protein